MTDPAIPGAGTMNVDPTSLRLGGSLTRQFVVTAVAILLGLLAGAILIIISGLIGPSHTLDLTLPITAYGAMLEGALGSPKAIANTLNAATPLIFTGLSVAHRLQGRAVQHRRQRAAADRRVLRGHRRRPSRGSRSRSRCSWRWPAGALGGAGWGFIPGALKAWRGAHEVVTTIMLNSIAYLLLNLIASTIFKDPNATFPRTPDITPEAAPADHPGGHRLTLGIVIALLTAVFIWFLLYKTTLGFEIRTVGSNPERRALRRHPSAPSS